MPKPNPRKGQLERFREKETELAQLKGAVFSHAMMEGDEDEVLHLYFEDGRELRVYSRIDLRETWLGVRVFPKD